MVQRLRMRPRSKSRDAFDEVANVYDKVRPGYPEQLIEDVVCLSGVPYRGRILEIGCGTGQATIPFAKRGYSMLCLEIGENLSAIARQNCRQYTNVEIRTVSFEDWRPEVSSFDLVISATAFHWIPPEIGYPKAAKVLRDSGAIALFWNLHPTPYAGFFQAVQKVYRRVVPEWESPEEGPSHEDQIRAREQYMDATGLFNKVTVRRYPWSAEFTADQYIELLDTYSEHRGLPEEKKSKLYSGVREVIEQFGGIVMRPYISALFVATKAPASPGRRVGRGARFHRRRTADGR